MLDTVVSYRVADNGIDASDEPRPTSPDNYPRLVPTSHASDLTPHSQGHLCEGSAEAFVMAACGPAITDVAIAR